MKTLLHMVVVSYLYFKAPHPCRPCHMKPGPLADTILQTSSGTAADPTPNDANHDDDNDLGDSD